MGGGDRNGDTEGPLCGVDGYSSWYFGEREGAVMATGGTVTPDGSLTPLNDGARPTTGPENTGGCKAALLSSSTLLESTKETRASFPEVLYTTERRAGTVRAFLRFQLERILHATKANKMVPTTVRDPISDLAEVER